MTQIEIEDTAPSRIYVASVGKKEVATGTIKEARKALWREAKRHGIEVPPTPREFMRDAVSGGGAWSKQVGKQQFTIKEFVVLEASA